MLFCILAPLTALATIESGKTYYLYNLGAQRWMNFGGGDGYTAAFLPYGAPLLLTASGDGYKITNTHYDSGSGLSASGAGKSTAATMTITEVSEGVYTIKAARGFFGYNSADENALHSSTKVACDLEDDGSDNVHWQLLTKEDLVARLESASEENPIDATFYIAAPGFNRHEYGLNTEWTLSNANVANTYYNPDQAGFCINDVAAGSEKTFSASQTLRGLKPGKYVLTCQGFYRAGSAGDALTAFNGGKYPNNAVLFAGEQTCPLKPIYFAGEGRDDHKYLDEGKATNSSWDWTNYTKRATTAEGDKYYPYWSTGNKYPNSAACVAFDNGLYQATAEYNRVEFEVSKNQDIAIGVKSTAALRYDWAAWDNMHLEYLGGGDDEDYYEKLVKDATGLHPVTIKAYDGTSAEGWKYEEIGAHTHGGFPIATNAINDGTCVDASKLQVWTGTQFNLGNSKTFVKYENIPNGYYSISTDMRVYDENGGYDGTVKGLSLYANGVSKQITTGEQIATGNLAGKGFIGSYSIVLKVENNTLETGIALNAANFNWVGWNNFIIRFLSKEDPAAEMQALDLTEGSYASLCLPYDVAAEDFGQTFLPVGCKDGVVSLLPVNNVAAGKACVVKASGNKPSKALSELTLNYAEPSLQLNTLDNSYVLGSFADNSWKMVDLVGDEKKASELTFAELDTENLALEMPVENRAVERYWAAAGYGENPSASIIADYNEAPPARRDQPKAFSLPLSDGTTLDIINVIPGKVYDIDHTDGNGIHYKGTVKATGELRMIYLSTGNNIRDLGGKLGIEGKRVAYGLIYRGATLNGYFNASSDDLKYLQEELNIGAELDLRYKDDYDKDTGCGTSPFGYTKDDGNYFFVGANDYLASHLSEADTQKRLKEEFLFILDNLKKGKAVYYHCAWGADRTGMLSMLLNGILGVGANDIYKDYELTSFAAAGNRLCTSFKDRMAVITALSGADLTEKFENYFQNKLGIAASDISDFRAIMFGEMDYTGIEEVSSPSSLISHPSALYDLSGRRVQMMQKGIYIMDGKKIVK